MGAEKNIDTFKSLVEMALRLGATAAAVIAAGKISVRDDLAMLCRQPRCSNFGLSMSCPPQVAGPAHFRALLRHFDTALAVKIDVPTEILLSDERREIMALLHEIVSGVERSAIDRGFADAAAFAGGCCKQLFCPDHESCRALGGGRCRNPQLARPSMSGFGIDVSALMQAAGWSGKTLTRKADADQSAMSWVAGLVLIQ